MKKILLVLETVLFAGVALFCSVETAFRFSEFYARYRYWAAGAAERDRILKTMTDAGIHAQARTVLDFYQSQIRSDIESLFIVFKSREALKKISDGMVVEGAEHLMDILKSRRGFILTSGHYGSWFIPLMKLLFDLPEGCALTANVVKIGRYHFIDRRIVDKLSRPNARLNFIYPYEDRLIVGRSVGRCLSRGEAMVAFYDADAYRSVQVPFLGKTAHFPCGLAHLARKYDVPILPFFTRREPDNRTLRIVIESPVMPAGRDDREIMSVLAKRLEERIRQAPDHWVMWDILEHVIWRGQGG